ncbi:MAG: NAD(P)-binding protein, partial [Hyphomonadaceae bacterium]|nr:NAD(P)-binding protein [Hyphomonadaceae bacterium]MCC6788141.1 NAD(P)-binding protein [Hyphomonadaceae bacterium]
MSASQKVDTVVIGAGVAGLGAAALLAKDDGQRVVVLE